MGGEDDRRAVADDVGLARYRRLIEGSGVGLFQTSTDGTVIWVNDAAARIVGYESADEFQKDVADIRQIYTDPSRRDLFQEEIEKHGSVSGFEYEIRRADGAIRWISVSARSLLRRDGSVEGYEGTVVDVTYRRLLHAAHDAVSSQLSPEEAVARFADVLAKVVPFVHVTLAVIEGDQYRRVSSIASDSATFFPENEQVPLAGNPMQEVVRTKQPVIMPDTSAGKWEFDRVLRDRGVESYAIFPLLDETGVFATFNIGVAEMSVFEGDVLSLLKSITVGVANAVRNILLVESERQAHLRLMEVDRLKKELFAWVSHDLRSPLAVIKGSAEVVEWMWDRLSDEEKLNRLRVIIRQTVRMEELVRRDLDLALIDSGELTCNKEPFDLLSVIGEIAADLEGSDTAHTFEVSASGEMPLTLGDRDRTVQVLGNLLSNAIKFAPAESPIALRVTQEKESLRVDVSNEGPGISDQDLDQIFERMSRLDPRITGTGLGLYISKHLIEAQEGQIWASSNPGEGVSFSFTLPIADPHDAHHGG